MSGEKRCLTCGGNFAYDRSSAKYCSESCRVQWHKRGSDMAVALMECEAWLARALHLMEKNPHWGTSEAYNTIASIRNRASKLDSAQLKASNERVEDYPLHPEHDDLSKRS